MIKRATAPMTFGGGGWMSVVADSCSGSLHHSLTGIHYLITVGTRSAIAETSGHTRLVYFRPRRVHCIDSAQLLLYGRVAWCVCICLGVRVGHES